MLNGLGSMDPDPHLVLGLSLTVFLHQLPELIHLTTLYFNEFIQLLSTQLLSTQLNEIGLCPSFWISTNQLTLIHPNSLLEEKGVCRVCKQVEATRCLQVV